MAIPIIYNNKKYFIISLDILHMYNVLYVGTVFINNRRYKNYITTNKNLLLEF